MNDYTNAPWQLTVFAWVFIASSFILTHYGRKCKDEFGMDGKGITLITTSCVCIVLALISVGTYFAYHYEIKGCKDIAKDTGYETKYPRISTGCYVNINNQWIPLESWRGENS